MSKIYLLLAFTLLSSKLVYIEIEILEYMGYFCSQKKKFILRIYEPLFHHTLFPKIAAWKSTINAFTPFYHPVLVIVSFFRCSDKAQFEGEKPTSNREGFF